MAQQRPRVQIEKNLYFDRNISDMSIDTIYFTLDISKVSIARSAYMVIRRIYYLVRHIISRFNGCA